ncbi:MAG TPA: hypothetical protein VFS09_04550 [Candidatus Eisenbacteria bacterium]|nr:hypothetical protein [Candidatus Eisenbacteria bacterium]
MNLPSSLALPQSKLLRSRVGILILVAAVALIGVVAFFALRAPSPTTMPTPATSPAAQVLPRTASTAPSAATANPAAGNPVVYGPPAPDWVKRDLSVVPKAPAPGAPSSVKTVGSSPSTVASAPVQVAPGATVPAPLPAAPASAAAVKPVPGTVTGAQVAPGAAASVIASKAVPVSPTMPVAGTGAAVDETPQVLDPNTLFQREQYVYQTAGRRDPFQSLLDGRFESQSGDGALVDVGDIHLVGIMWGSSDKFALVEDSRGRGFVLRVGDPVVNGYIAGISKTELQVVQNAFGDSQTVTIQLKSKEEGDPNATRKQ